MINLKPIGLPIGFRFFCRFFFSSWIKKKGGIYILLLTMEIFKDCKIIVEFLKHYDIIEKYNPKYLKSFFISLSD